MNKLFIRTTALISVLSMLLSQCAQAPSNSDLSENKQAEVKCAPVEFDGYTYEVLFIGGNCWFAENLSTRQYANGDSILSDFDETEWALTTDGAQAISNSQSLTDYGRLYNWYAVVDNRGLCPSGWRVPDKKDYDKLGTDYYKGNGLKSSATDRPSWDGSNELGFSGLPGGFRKSEGRFVAEGKIGAWWTSSRNGVNAWSWYLESRNDGSYLQSTSRNFGLSVRCIQIE